MAGNRAANGRCQNIGRKRDAPGWLQIADTLLVLVSTLGITFAMFGRTHRNLLIDIVLRCCMAAISFVVMFHPDMKTSASVAVVVMLAVVVGIWRHIQIAPTTYAITDAETGAEPSGDLAPVLASAKRDIG